MGDNEELLESIQSGISSRKHEFEVVLDENRNEILEIRNIFIPQQPQEQVVRRGNFLPITKYFLPRKRSIDRSIRGPAHKPIPLISGPLPSFEVFKKPKSRHVAAPSNNNFVMGFNKNYSTEMSEIVKRRDGSEIESNNGAVKESSGVFGSLSLETLLDNNYCTDEISSTVQPPIKLIKTKSQVPLNRNVKNAIHTSLFTGQNEEIFFVTTDTQPIIVEYLTIDMTAYNETTNNNQLVSFSNENLSGNHESSTPTKSQQCNQDESSGLKYPTEAEHEKYLEYLAKLTSKSTVEEKVPLNSTEKIRRKISQKRKSK